MGKINLEYPYSEDYKAGYLNYNKENRGVVLLVGHDNKQTSTAYARYLLACSIGRYLTSEEQADHIDNDKTNDDIENLQILSGKDNNKKWRDYAKVTRSLMTLVCPICNIEFTREARNLKGKLANGKSPCCSKNCGGKYSHKVKLLSYETNKNR